VVVRLINPEHEDAHSLHGAVGIHLALFSGALGDCPEDVTESLSILLATSGESTNRSKSRVMKRLSAQLTNSSNRNENKPENWLDPGTNSRL
jgi:hypothetical protein